MGDVSELGRLVKEHRERRSLSQKRLGQMAGGLSDGYISQLETGSRGKRPQRDIVIALAQALSVSANELLDAAGLPLVPEDHSTEQFAAIVRADPLLRADQKKILVDLYTVFVGKSA